MSEPPIDPAGPEPAKSDEDVPVVHPVFVEGGPGRLLERSIPAAPLARPLPSGQAAVVAAGSFAVGIVAAALARRVSPRGRRRRRADVVSTRSFLVDVHVLRD